MTNTCRGHYMHYCVHTYVKTILIWHSSLYAHVILRTPNTPTSVPPLTACIDQPTQNHACMDTNTTHSSDRDQRDALKISPVRCFRRVEIGNEQLLHYDYCASMEFHLPKKITLPRKCYQIGLLQSGLQNFSFKWLHNRNPTHLLLEELHLSDILIGKYELLSKEICVNKHLLNFNNKKYQLSTVT